jgi:hypothetical protein
VEKNNREAELRERTIERGIIYIEKDTRERDKTILKED